MLAVDTFLLLILAASPSKPVHAFAGNCMVLRMVLKSPQLERVKQSPDRKTASENGGGPCRGCVMVGIPGTGSYGGKGGQWWIIVGMVCNGRIGGSFRDGV